MGVKECFLNLVIKRILLIVYGLLDILVLEKSWLRGLRKIGLERKYYYFWEGYLKGEEKVCFKERFLLRSNWKVELKLV